MLEYLEHADNCTVTVTLDINTSDFFIEGLSVESLKRRLAHCILLGVIDSDNGLGGGVAVRDIDVHLTKGKTP